MAKKVVKRKKKKKKIKFSFKKAIILMSIIAITCIYLVSNKYDTRIYPGVKIETIDVGGKTKEEAQSIIKKKFKENVLKSNLVFKTPNEDYIIKCSELGLKHNIEETINNAFKYGKNKGLIARLKLIKAAEEKQFQLVVSYNKKPIDKMVNKIETQYNKNAINPKMFKNQYGGFDVVSGKSGTRVNSKKLKADINNIVNNKFVNDLVIHVKVESVQPKVTKQDMQKIDGKISTYNTNFSASQQGRCTNIELATKAINGIVLMPGDSFSFNEVVGERTAEKGYQPAPVIVGERLEDGLGGGICQVSTTLYNAVLRANILSKERSHHTMASHYVGLGMDATVDYGNLDYSFKNTLQYPICIEGYCENKNLTFNIYSNSKLQNRSYDIVNEVYETIPYEIIYIDDYTLPRGIENVDKEGAEGKRVKVYKIGYENGREISRELINKDYYAPISRVIKRGIK